MSICLFSSFVEQGDAHSVAEREGAGCVCHATRVPAVNRMKLSPDKIEQLATSLIDYLAEVDGVLFRGDDSQLRLAAQQIIADELMVEERLDAEIHKMLQAYKYEITMGRMSYDELFKKTKQRMIRERRLVL